MEMNPHDPIPLRCNHRNVAQRTTSCSDNGDYAPGRIEPSPIDAGTGMVDIDSSSAFARLFCAVVWNAPTREPLHDLQAAVRAVHPGAPLLWIAPDDMHLTLRYFGDASEALRHRLVAAGAELAKVTPVSTLDFLRLETWPPIRPRVLVARFRVEPVLNRLQAALDREARAQGLAPEVHRFQPHVTLARAAPGWNGGLARIKLPALRLHATEIALWHKHLQPEGRRYVETARWSLAPAPAHDL
jgi:2'-5' RNA ligase